MSYVSRKSAEWMKSYNIFLKSIFLKSPNFAPPQFRNRGAFWVTKTIFGILYQPWATQIGSRAKFMQNCHAEGQNWDFSYRFSRFFYEIGIRLREM